MSRPAGIVAGLVVGLTVSALAGAGTMSSAAAPTTTSTPPPTPTTVVPSTTAPPSTTPAPSTTAAPSTTVAPTTTVAPAGISDDAIRTAKVAWAQFVSRNFATPNAILDPCPLMTVDEANAAVTALGLTPTDLPYGVGVFRDFVGAGITGISCGADLSKSASPQGATLFAVEVTLLDGQAVFPQYVIRVGGRNTPIERAAPELGGEMFARCRDDPQVCIASWHGDGLIVTVKLDGPRTDQSEAQVRQLLLAVAPQVVDNLAANAPAS